MVSKMSIFGDNRDSVPDFSDLGLSDRTYGGADAKIGVVYEGSPWFIKLRRQRGESGLGYSHISEHIGCGIFSIMGVSVQETRLGLYRGEEVVIIRDFCNGGELVEFNSVGSSTTYEEEVSKGYSFSEIEGMIYRNTKLKDKDEVVTRFWRMFVVDAIIGNFDRHGYNWGYLRNEFGNYKLAPVFDCGSCLFPRLTDNRIFDEWENEERVHERVYKFPTSQVLLDGSKSSYYQIITSNYFSGCVAAKDWLCDYWDAKRVDALIESALFISDVRKKFLKNIINLRYRCIILGEEFKDVYRKFS